MCVCVSVRARGPDKGSDGCLCARACACEYVRNDGEGALIWITPRLLGPKKGKEKNPHSFGGVGGVNVRVFWVGVWGRETHGFQMLTLPLQVVGDRMRLRLQRRVLAPDPTQQKGTRRWSISS